MTAFDGQHLGRERPGPETIGSRSRPPRRGYTFVVEQAVERRPSHARIEVGVGGIVGPGAEHSGGLAVVAHRPLYVHRLGVRRQVASHPAADPGQAGFVGELLVDRGCCRQIAGAALAVEARGVAQITEPLEQAGAVRGFAVNDFETGDDDGPAGDHLGPGAEPAGSLRRLEQAR